ncbi:hypothetical protein PISL3812_00735 [Talaromyces islandicus]|uniref:Uncharacterized protein n=1 Tax=Talaromyces islandicus TaxID=28573 RepID=A0A0U1LK35_TALIS|nr:hypothetical protein PISL3812_00735 [Talaromyces islandicus]
MDEITNWEPHDDFVDHRIDQTGDYNPAQSPWSLNDRFSHNPTYIASQDELRGIIFSIAQSGAPTRAGSPAMHATEHLEDEPRLLGSHIASKYADITIEQTKGENNKKQMIYLKNYVREVAPWLDMFDSQNTFGIQLPILAHDFPALRYAILAISARQMERKNGTRDSFDSLELYQESIRLLSPLLQVRDANVIATCVLLCCLEMMSARGQDWRRHLEGCAALFNAFEIHGFSSGLLQAVFWCYARMVMEMFIDFFWKLDLQTYYTGSTELGHDNGCTDREFERRWMQLWEDLQKWVLQRPAELLPVQTTKMGPFVHMFFSFWAAISSNQLYHTACILLLGVKPGGTDAETSSVKSPVWHARRVCGISLANPHHGCLNNAVQPLWLAGRLFSHKAEHDAIISLIQEIEAASGWAACWRINDLKMAWGYTVP